MHFNILSWNSIEDVLPSPHPAHASPDRRTHECTGFLLHPPHFNFGTTPGFGPPRPECTWSTADASSSAAAAEFGVRFPPRERNAGKERGRTWERGGPRVLLILLFPSFFPAALSCQCFLHTLLLAGFQIKGVALHLLDDVFLLHLTFEAAQCILEGLALLQSDFCQRNYTPRLVLFGPDSYCKVLHTSQELKCDSRPSRGHLDLVESFWKSSESHSHSQLDLTGRIGVSDCERA